MSKLTYAFILILATLGLGGLMAPVMLALRQVVDILLWPFALGGIIIVGMTVVKAYWLFFRHPAQSKSRLRGLNDEDL